MTAAVASDVVDAMADALMMVEASLPSIDSLEPPKPPAPPVRRSVTLVPVPWVIVDVCVCICTSDDQLTSALIVAFHRCDLLPVGTTGG